MRKMVMVCLGLLLALGVVALATGCGGSSDSSSTDTSATTGGEESSSNPEIAKAEQVVDKYEEVPTGIGIETPLSKAPPSGKKLYFLECDLPICKEPVEGTQQAAEQLGWDVTVLPYKSADPNTILADVETAIGAGADMVLLTAAPEISWGQTIKPKLKAAGVPLIVSFVGEAKVDDVTVANVTPKTTYERFGELMAAYTTVTTEGEGKVLLTNAPDFELLDPFIASYNSNLKSFCSGCSVVPLDISLAQLGESKTPEAVVSKMQSDPDINATMFTFSDLTAGLPAALRGAGISEQAEIVGISPEVRNFEAIVAGEEAAWGAMPLIYTGWLMVDTAARYFIGDPLEAEEVEFPIRLLTAENLDESEASKPYEEPPDYREQFEALWEGK